MNAKVDLHGYTLEEALVIVEAFINEEYSKNNSILEIITGNGKIYGQALAAVREHPLVAEVYNDGPLGFKYVGRLVIELDGKDP